MDSPIYILLTVAIMIGCILTYVSARRKEDAHVLRYYGWVHALILFATITFSVMAGAFIFELNPPGWLLMVCFVVWTVAAITILLNTRVSTGTKLVGVLVLVIPVVFSILPGGIQQFLTRFDSFIYEAFYDSVEVPSSTEPERTMSPAVLLKAIFSFLTAFLVINFYGRFLRVHRWAPSSDDAGQSLHQSAIDKLILMFSIGAALIIAFLFSGGSGISFGVFAGFIGIGLTVALRELIQNFVSGLIMLWDKSIQINDVIVIDGDRCGVVKSIRLRYITVEDRDERHMLIPHTQLMNANIENWTHGTDGKQRQVRLRIDIGIAYDSVLEKADEVMESTAYDVPRVLPKPPPKAFIVGTDDSSIHFQLRFWIEDPENGIANVMSDMYKALMPKLKDAKIIIPFPQREIRILKDKETSKTRDSRSVEKK